MERKEEEERKRRKPAGLAPIGAPVEEKKRGGRRNFSFQL
jgi:hypothetical protein